MKNIQTALLILTLLVSSALFAGLGVPGELNPLLASAEISINNVEGYRVEKIRESDGIRLKVLDPQGKEFWASEILGDDEKMFVFNGESNNLLVADLNANNRTEIITATSFPPHNGSLYVFALDKEQKSFVPMQFRSPNGSDSKDFLVADIHQENGQDLAFIDTRVRALGMLYPENEESEAVASFFYYKLSDNMFTYDGCESVPVE